MVDFRKGVSYTIKTVSEQLFLPKLQLGDPMPELSNTVYSFCSDPSHGWLAVPQADLARVGLSAADLSTFSFRDSEYFYLEEDMDYAIFCRAFERTVGHAPNVRFIPGTRGNHPIRRKNRNIIGCTDCSKLIALMA